MTTFRKASWTDEKRKDAKEDLNKIFRDAVGYGEKKMNPHAGRILDKDAIDIAQLIFRVIEQEVTVTDPLPFLVEEVTGDIRDNYLYHELDKSYRVVNRSYGSKPLSQRLTFKEYAIATTQKEVAVEIPLEEVFAGVFTPALAAEEIAFAINRFRISSVLDALDNGVAAVPDRTGVSGYTLRYTGFTQANLDKAIDGLQDEAEAVSIFGRHIVINPVIRGFTGWAAGASALGQATMDELFARGVVGSYHNAQVVTLKDTFAKRAQSHVIRKDRVYIAGDVKGAFHMTKPVDFLNYAFTDPRTGTFATGVRIEDGTLVWDQWRYRIVEV